jgi:hypothetical protein
MARAKRTVEEEWYDLFAGWDLRDQAIALKVLEQINRQARRGKSAKTNEAPEGKTELPFSVKTD